MPLKQVRFPQGFPLFPAFPPIAVVLIIFLLAFSNPAVASTGSESRGSRFVATTRTGPPSSRETRPLNPDTPCCAGANSNVVALIIGCANCIKTAVLVRQCFIAINKINMETDSRKRAI
ncbi:hypothetical protein C8R47DRAFT_1031454 [Mycena vitilis]|nr:hypothetical protein C8R47DRAFT_1031454 [Mycena vitilis]